MVHLHITSWVLGFILFFIGYALLKNPNQQKPGTILHMILRLDYILIFISGLWLLVIYFNSDLVVTEAVIKGVAGLWLIWEMERILIRTKKSGPTKGDWIQFTIALLLVLALGFGRLPMGFLP